MNATITKGPNAASRRGTFWALVPVALLAVALTGLLAMASIARDDPGFALEPNYYERAVRWDQQQLEWAENARLGYRLSAETPRQGDAVELRVALTDRSGTPVPGAVVSVEAFANARAAEMRQLVLEERADGTYRASLGAARPGLWEFRFRVRRDNERFTASVRSDVPARSGLP